MASSEQFPVGASAVLLVSAPPGTTISPVGWFSLANGSGGSIYIGGAGVAAGNGYSIAASGTFSAFLFPGDAVYAVQNSAPSTVSVFATGV